MQASANIRNFINGLPEGAIFCTRQLLNFGTRAAVDQCLCRLVKNGDIRRLAWGLFMRDDDLELPAVLVVATEKAKAFGKKLISDGADAARLLGFVSHGNQKPTYSIDGRSSSFKFKGERIYFNGISARKMALGNHPIGLTIRALWQLGKSNCRPSNISLVLGNLKVPSCQQLMRSRHLMPTWMTSLLTNID